MAKDSQGPRNGKGPDDRSRPLKGPGSSEEFVLQIMAVLGGSGAVAALPLLATIVAGQAPPQLQLIVFAFPLALAAVGRLREKRSWQIAAAVLVVLLVVAFLFSIGELAVLLLAAGAIGSLILVGKYLLDHDRIAGGAWLAAGSIATIGGFAALAAGATGVAATVGVVVLLGAAIALARLRRTRPQP
jgi:hypothetical protein